MSAEITPEKIAELRKQISACVGIGFIPMDKRSLRRILDALESSRAEVQRLQRERDAAIDERNAWRSGDQDSRIEADRLRGEIQRLTEEARRLREIEVSDEVRGLLTAHGSDGIVLVCGEFASGREFVEKYRMARRSDAGRVEVPELTDPEAMDICKRWGKPTLFSDRNMVREAYNLARSRLSPSPQPATGAVVDIPALTAEDMEQVTGREFFNGFRTGYHLAKSRARIVPSPQPSADVVVVPREEWEATIAMAEAFVTEPDMSGSKEECEGIATDLESLLPDIPEDW